MFKTDKRPPLTREEIGAKILKQHSPRYGKFVLIQMGYSPPICPECRRGSFTTLWLANPRNVIDGKLWAKWYFWCDDCLSGIYCPLGTWRIPRTTPHLIYGDKTAIRAALPQNLKLIQSRRPTG
jgi:hypothetical protein